MGLNGLAYSVGGGTDESTQTLTYTVTAVPDAAVGTIYLDDGQTTVGAQQNLSITELQGLQFLAAPNAAGQATFSFSVTDSGNGDNTITETVNLDILGFNDTPVLPTTAITIADAQEDQAYTFSANDLLAGVTDPDIQYDANGDIASRPYGDTLSVVNLSVSNGNLDYDATTELYTFTPDANFNGVARFNYLINDGQGGSISNTVNLNVVSINDAPIATFATDQVTAEGNSSIGGLLTSTDVDRFAEDGVTPEAATFSLLSASIDNAAAVTTVPGLTINANGTWSFDPTDAAYNALAAGDTQTIDVTYQVADADGLTANNTFSITVNGTNDTPEATFSTLQSATEDATTVSGQLTANDPDLGTVLSYQLVGAPIDGLSINATTGDWSFDPTHASYQSLKQDQTLDITVNYSVTDDQGASDQSAFVITLTGSNDAPTLTGIKSSLPGGSEDTAYTITKAPTPRWLHRQRLR